MNKAEREILRQYQSEYNRRLEEAFAQVLSEEEGVRLFFINEGQAYTDGRNIVVDPAHGELFADRNALALAERYMGLRPSISRDLWMALRMITRGQTIHECLHVLFTDFPGALPADPRCTTKARRITLSLIGNIIEDAFVEAAGCSLFDHLVYFLQFSRLASLYGSKPEEGTVSRVINEGKVGEEPAETLPLVRYLEYMACFLLYPMLSLPPPKENIEKYVHLTKQLFLDGSACGKPAQRHACCQQIFDIIEPLIPESEKLIDQFRLLQLLFGNKTHNGEAGGISVPVRKGREAGISKRLFGGLDGKAEQGRDFTSDNQAFSTIVQAEKNAALNIVQRQPIIIKKSGDQLGGGHTHKDIEVIETHPRPNLDLRRAYLNIYNRHRAVINTYNSRFAQLLKAKVSVREERRLFGAGISSKYLTDPKKKYWYRVQPDKGVPDLSILLLIDGSGSMYGERQESAMRSAVILHEVLKKQDLPHAIIEHRAGMSDPTMEINVLVGFHASEEDKYNLMALDSFGDNRDGLALYWAERYITKHTHTDQRMVIVLADGYPAHEYDGYYPPASDKDTAKAANNMLRHGTYLIAVALDDGHDEETSCYDALKGIYPHVVSCTDLNRLTGQLLGIISRQLR